MVTDNTLSHFSEYLGSTLDQRLRTARLGAVLFVVVNTVLAAKVVGPVCQSDTLFTPAQPSPHPCRVFVALSQDSVPQFGGLHFEQEAEPHVESPSASHLNWRALMFLRFGVMTPVLLLFYGATYLRCFNTSASFREIW